MEESKQPKAIPFISFNTKGESKSNTQIAYALL